MLATINCMHIFGTINCPQKDDNDHHGTKTIDGGVWRSSSFSEKQHCIAESEFMSIFESISICQGVHERLIRIATHERIFKGRCVCVQYQFLLLSRLQIGFDCQCFMRVSLSIDLEGWLNARFDDVKERCEGLHRADCLKISYALLG